MARIAPLSCKTDLRSVQQTLLFGTCSNLLVSSAQKTPFKTQAVVEVFAPPGVAIIRGFAEVRLAMFKAVGGPCIWAAAPQKQKTPRSLGGPFDHL